MAEDQKLIKFGKKCCVLSCENTDLNKKGVHFYRVIRSRSQTQSEKWIQIIKEQNGEDWTPAKDSRICSSHFVTGECSSNSDHQDFFPTIFGNVKESDIARTNRRTVSYTHLTLPTKA